MHEVSIVMGMMDELTRIAGENHAKKITSVRVKIGAMSGIVTDSLKFAFDAIKLEQPLMASAEISINEVPLIYKCNKCNATFEAGDIYLSACGNCSSNNLEIISGQEQHIESVEVEV